MLRDLVVGCTGGTSWDRNTDAWVALANGWLYVNQSAEVHVEILRLLGRIEGRR